MKVFFLPPQIETVISPVSTQGSHFVTTVQYDASGNASTTPMNITGLDVPKVNTTVIDFADSVRAFVGMGSNVIKSYNTITPTSIGRNFWSFSELVDYVNDHFVGALYLESSRYEHHSWNWFTSHLEDYDAFVERLGKPKGPILKVKKEVLEDARQWAIDHNMVVDFRDINNMDATVYVKDDDHYVHFKLRWG